MPDSLMLTCPLHERPLIPSPVIPGGLLCPEAECPTAVRIGAPGGLFSSPLTPLGEGAAGHHELVCTYQAAGFTRTEAMQVLCCLISASIMKDKGSD